MPRYQYVAQVAHDRSVKPGWLRVKSPTGENYERIKSILRTHSLHTVCEEAHCPNVGECWGGGTAAFMLMGGLCSRGCRFCMVRSGRPQGLDPIEPLKVARAIADLNLRYVVITSVDRDDLPDGGAEHFASTIRAIKTHDPDVITEVLIPDFNGKSDSIHKVVKAGPEVIAHNIETTATLTPKIRDPRATYDQSLHVLKTIKDLDSNVFSKSSVMLGLGETEPDLVQAMRDLRDAEVDILTLGQYLRPSQGHIPVTEFVTPERFAVYKRVAEGMGFLYVAAGPFVRSSYRAGEFFVEAMMKDRSPFQA